MAGAFPQISWDRLSLPGILHCVHALLQVFMGPSLKAGGGIVGVWEWRVGVAGAVSGCGAGHSAHAQCVESQQGGVSHLGKQVWVVAVCSSLGLWVLAGWLFA